MVRKAWRNMGVISSGYTVYLIQAGHLLHSTVHERGWYPHRLSCPLYSLIAQSEPELKGVERTGLLLLPCAHTHLVLTPQQLDSTPNNLISKEIQHWKKETNPCGCVAPPSPAFPLQMVALAWTLEWCWVLPEAQKPSAVLAESCEKIEPMELWAKLAPWVPNHIEEDKNHRLWLERFLLILGKIFSSGGTAVLEQVPGTECASFPWGFPKN